MRPQSFLLPKVFLPILTPTPPNANTSTPPRVEGAKLHVRPALDILLHDVLHPSTGIDDVCVVASAEQLPFLHSFLRLIGKPSTRRGPSTAAASFPTASTAVGDWDVLGGRVSVVLQPSAAGFGDAVLQGAGHVAQDEHFFVVLSDHLFTRDNTVKRPAVADLAALVGGSTPTASSHSPPWPAPGAGCFEALQQRFTALQEQYDDRDLALTSVGSCTLDEVPSNGLVAAATHGRPASSHGCFQVGSMVEKPEAEPAVVQQYSVPNGADTSYLCNFGIDILPFCTFEILRDLKQRQGRVASGSVTARTPPELGLRQAQGELMRVGRLFGLTMDGYSRHDFGNPDVYWSTLQHMASSD